MIVIGIVGGIIQFIEVSNINKAHLKIEAVEKYFYIDYDSFEVKNLYEK